MYLQHFGLQELPFRITPDTRLFFGGGHRGDVLAALKYAILGGEGIVKVVGEVGSGKTMLCRVLEKQLPEHVNVVYIANPSISPDNILNVIAFELGLTQAPLSKLEVIQRLQEWLLEQHGLGQGVVLFIEEAQSMPLATLEEIRLLSNLETERGKLLQIVLFGQPELDTNLEQYEIRQLKERISHQFYLSPLDAQACYAYLNFRTRVAGYQGPDLFTLSAARLIVRCSTGLIRRINLIADKALLACYAEGLQKLTPRHIRMAIQDCHFSDVMNKPRRWLPRYAAVAAGLSIVMLLPNWLPKQNVISLAQARPVAAIQSEALPPVEHNSELEQDNIKIEYALDDMLLSQRLKATESWLMSSQASERSIQLISITADKKSDIGGYINKLAVEFRLDIELLYVYPSQLQGRNVYSVLFGSYKSRREAKHAISQLPEKLKQQGPFLVRSVQGIQNEMAETAS